MFKILGYYVSGNSSSKRSLLNNYNKTDIILPTWLKLKADGSIVSNKINNEIKKLKRLKENKAIVPVVQNYQLSSEVSNNFIKNKRKWTETITELIKFIKQGNYNSLNIDIEGIKKQNKDKLTNFIEKLAYALNDVGYKVSISLPAKTEDNHSAWSGAYDYQELGRLVNYVIIMAYDYHWVNGPPGAIAPLTWVQDTIDYAVMKIDINKIYLGIPCYGYDWLIDSPKEEAQGLSYSQVMNLKEKNGVSVNWDQESETPYIKYRDKNGNHEVWFENKDSIIKKINLIKEFQLAGAAFWRLGLEDSGIWKYL